METQEKLLAEIADLRARLQEAEETLRAIGQGEVDALVVSERRGERVYTLKSPDPSYRLMIEEMGQGAVTLTASGAILYCNRSFARMLRMAPGEGLAGACVQSFLAPEGRSSFDRLLWRGSGRAETELLVPDGTRVPVYLAVTSLPFEEEPVFCLVVTDLTDQKRRAAAEAMNQAKDRFLATLSHELRTPLTPVLAVLSSLEMDVRVAAELHSDLAMMRRNIELEARLIDDLLDLTRIARGKIELQRALTDLRQVLEHALQTSCSEEAASGRLSVAADLPAESPLLWADSSRLTQVFCNLLNNAVKFTPDGGTIRLRSWREEGPPRLVVEISDTGIGIEPDLLPRIFDAFEQGEPGAARRSGLGLGLAISKAIVELHGGELIVFSEGKDRGAAFTVRLPAGPLPEEAEAAPDAGTAAEPAGDEVSRPLHILLVEDHQDTAEALAELLSLCGHRVTMAHSMAEGIARADILGVSAQRPGGLDLVISDLGLPDGTGLDLMRELTGRHPVPGIALSGYGMEEDVRKSREAGFLRHLTKPVNVQALEDAIRETAREAALI